jgi:hypothetical protein
LFLPLLGDQSTKHTIFIRKNKIQQFMIFIFTRQLIDFQKSNACSDGYFLD